MGRILIPVLAQALGRAAGNNPEAGSEPEGWVVLGYFVILVLSGAFGGLIGSLDPDKNFRLPPLGRPKENEPLELGWLGGLLVGVAASLGIMLIGDTFGVLQGTRAVAFQLLRLVALGVIAGYAGHSLLVGLRERVKNLAKSQADEQVHKQTEGLRAEMREVREDTAKETERMLEMNHALNEADRLLLGGDYERAQIAFERVRDRFPLLRPRAEKGIANCLAYLGLAKKDDDKLAEADRLLKRLESEFPEDEGIAYNRMWVAVLIHERDRERGRTPTYSTDELRKMLDKAIKLDPEAKRWAKYERGLHDLLVREPTIAELVGGPPEGDGRRKWRAGQFIYHRPDCRLASEDIAWDEGVEPPPYYAPCTSCLP
jgi:tetratricopeptide (TPR) repeat protein